MTLRHRHWRGKRDSTRRRRSAAGRGRADSGFRGCGGRENPFASLHDKKKPLFEPNRCRHDGSASRRPTTDSRSRSAAVRVVARKCCRNPPSKKPWRISSPPRKSPARSRLSRMATNILHLSADGLADIENKTPMATDSIFWIASMTKPITATAVMMMQEEGKLSVDDPVSKYLPEFTGDKAGDHHQTMPHPHQRPERSQAGRGEKHHHAGGTHAARRRQAAGVSAGQQVAVLPDRHQHGGADRRGGFRQIVSRFPAGAAVRSARHEGHQFLSESRRSFPASRRAYNRTAAGELEKAGSVLPRREIPLREKPLPDGQRRPVLHRAGLCEIRANDPQRRRVRRETLSESGVRQTNDHRAKRRSRHRLHPRKRLGPRLVRRPRTAGC